MKMLRMDPPGTWCQNEALFQRIDRPADQALRFLEVGCGDGSVSRLLCERGYSGVGVDFSETSLGAARENLKGWIDDGHYELVASDFAAYRPSGPLFDVVLSMMVVEHVADDDGFVQHMAECVRPGGQVIVGVPGRRDAWGLEDETVGHLRRYDRADLDDLLTTNGLVDVEVWSVGVPTVNVLRRVGNYMVGRSVAERKKLEASDLEQTKESGVRDIPFKTTFPKPFGLLLNRFAMWPLTQVQRAFYKTDLGVTMIGTGRRR